MRAPKLSSNVQRNAPETLIQPASQPASKRWRYRTKQQFVSEVTFCSLSALKACSE